MTMPHERMGGLRWGYELVHSIAIDESLPETLRSRALAVAADYPAPEVIEQVRREGNRGLEPSAVGASCNARRLLNDVARTKDLLDPRRREVQGTSVVVVRVLDHLVVAGAGVCSFAKRGLVQTLTRGVSRRPASACFKRG